jgi:threonylcarbamoyladenosine tRNA methylthiotransferase MtaB
MHSEEASNRAAVFVLGCKVNQAEANGICQILTDHGFQIGRPENEPHLVVVNTCCVTSRAEAKSRRLVKRLQRLFPEARLVVTGCLAQISPECFAGKNENLEVVANDQKTELNRILSAMGCVGVPTDNDKRSGDWRFADLGVKRSTGKAREFIKIQDGCPQSCTYCIVPAARGPSRSLSADRIFTHVKTLRDNGAAEIVLTGVNLGCYGHDLGSPKSLEGLLFDLLASDFGVRFRLSSLEPQHLSSGLIDLAATSDRLCRHFHIPLQSGDDEILTNMRRPYNTAFIREVTYGILSRIPDACLGFDVIVGFPGETEEAFRRTVDLVTELNASYLHIFPFSPRPGTEASRLTHYVSESEIKGRVERLGLLAKELRVDFWKRNVGKILPAVVESGPDPSTGHVLVRSDNYIPVYCPENGNVTPNRCILVRVTGVEQGRVWGTIESLQQVP